MGNYLATVAMDACEVIILDIRVPCTPVARLNNHRACVNGIAWAPHSSCHICTAGDDHQVCIQLFNPDRSSKSHSACLSVSECAILVLKEHSKNNQRSFKEL